MNLSKKEKFGMHSSISLILWWPDPIPRVSSQGAQPVQLVVCPTLDFGLVMVSRVPG